MTISFILSLTLLLFINSTNSETANNDDDNNPILTAKSSIQQPSYDYVCIVDAGSTGSRIHVYRYTQSPTSKLISVDIKSEQYQKFYPGLSSFEDHPKDLNAMAEYFEPILNFGRDKVPFSKRTATPLFVLASAGMRKVRDRNSKTAQQIMDIVYQHLSESSEFIVLRDGIKIIEGRNEGLWGWIAANYLNGELANLLALSAGTLYSAQTSKGVVEMGGESLQITFIPSKSSLNSLSAHPHKDSAHHIETVRIGDMEVKLFTYSWMGIGMEAAQNQYDTYLATKVGEREKSPCYIRGDVKERQHGIGQSITWKGTGSFGECYEGLSTMIEDKLMHGCVVPEIEKQDMICTPNKVLIPAIDLGRNGDRITVPHMNEFYYIENFYYTAKVLNLLGVHGKQFLDKLQEKGEYYCSLEVEKAKIEYPDATEEEIKKTCFCASWLLALLNRGFNLEKFERFRVIRDIEGQGNIDWALGYLVAEVPNMNLNEDGLSETLYTFRFLLMIMVIVSILYCWYKGNRKNDSKSWLYSKMGFTSDTGNKKENTNKYAYQRLNVRRTH